MRRAVKLLESNCRLTKVRRFDDALESIEKESFDVAIIDPGWWGDFTRPQATKMVDGWLLVGAIQKQDEEHPERRSTAQIIYSSQFKKDPLIAERAAKEHVLPFYKPEPPPLPSAPKREKLRHERDLEVACQALRAIVAFAGYQRNSELERLLQTANERMRRATKAHDEWHRLTLRAVPAAVLIIFAGVVASLAGYVQGGAVTAANGVIAAAIGTLLYRRLDKAQAATDDAYSKLRQSLQDARVLPS
jgi:hypothetical protein